uniref:dTTP/UTP pyrophosphatase-like n=1 Tax=Styela clava TaxID=7725 RepID=UPI00193A42F9|nr:dTTP/UTP pyrophosphatase-like [Styela clava]
MLSPLRELLQQYQLILASSSSQRKAIWRQIGLKFTTKASPFDEESVNPNDFADASKFVEYLAHHKAEAVVRDLERNEQLKTIVVGADTVIVDNEKIIGKPHTHTKAIETLTRLSGRTHNVFTGVSIILVSSLQNKEGNREASFVSRTEVEFASLSEETIKSYVQSDEPLNKAGAYGIQGLGATLVKSIKGDYYNVVGFPIQEFCEKLEILLRFENL